MAIDSATFKIRYPAFADIDDALIDPKITLALAIHEEAAFGTEIHEEICFAFAAWQLTDEPFGLPMGLTTDVNAQENNRYKQNHQELLKRCIRRGQISGGGLT